MFTARKKPDHGEGINFNPNQGLQKKLQNSGLKQHGFYFNTKLFINK
jgi:hypothetical protein